MMMQEEAFEVPESAQRVRIVTEGGLDASCFIQANSWHPGCEVAWKNWTQFATGVNLRNASIACIMDDTLPWHSSVKRLFLAVSGHQTICVSKFQTSFSPSAQQPEAITQHHPLQTMT
jgi:hypothetical protein